MQMKITIATLTMVGLVGVAAAQPKTGTAAGSAAPAKAAPAKAEPKAMPAKAADPKAADPKAAGAKAADPKAAPAKVEAPKPPAEVAAMAKTSVGTFRCTGTSTGADGAAAKMTATLTSKLDLDKWWVTETLTAKGAQGTYKSIAHTTYDATSKKWRRVSVDNMGTQFVGTSDGMQGTKLDWNMDMMSGMGAGMFRDHMETVDKRSVKFSGEMSMDKGKTWKPVYEMTCKK